MLEYSIPLKNGKPIVKWGQYDLDHLPSDEDRKGAKEFALLCGEISGIIGLDIDSDEDEAKILALVGGAALPAKRGSKGRTIFFKYNGENNYSWMQNGKVALELLSDKRLTTIPPSKHRYEGKPSYVWINEGAELTEFPSHLISVFDALYPAPKKEFKIYNAPMDFEKTTLDEVEEMLGCISPDCSRNEWVSIGMGLRDEYGDAAFAVWDKWSSASAKYKQREMYCAWRSFNGSGYTIATVVFLAQQAGYIKRYEGQHLVATACDLSAVTKADLLERKELIAHGLVGEIADWITATATRPQPQLAMGAALTFMGMVKGHKYETVTQLRTNLYVMNIAPSGAGKDDPLKAIDMLAEAVGLSDHLLAEPTAGTSLLRGLKDDAGRIGLWAIDEFGRYLAHVTSKNSGNYQKEIIDYLIKMFGRASGTMLGKKFADEKKSPRINIVQPHLCVLGASVKEHIIDNCTSKDAIDGFLNRWILFESTERPRMKIGKKRVAVPESIIAGIKKILADDPNAGYPIGVDEKPAVKEVRYTPEAWAMIKQYQEDVEDLIDKSQPILQALYTRTYEHTTKLALILCDNQFIRVEDVKLAVEIVTESNKLIADLSGLISDNEQEKMVNKLLLIVKAHKKGIKHADLIRRSKFLNAKSRTEILNDLSQSGEITAEKSGKTYIYY